MSKKSTARMIFSIVFALSVVLAFSIYILIADSKTPKEIYDTENAYVSPAIISTSGQTENGMISEVYDKERTIPFLIADKNGFRYQFEISFYYEYLLQNGSTDADAMKMCDGYFEKFKEIFESTQIPYEEFVTSKEPILSLVANCGDYLKQNSNDNILFHLSVEGYGSNESDCQPVDSSEFAKLLPDNYRAVVDPSFNTANTVFLDDSTENITEEVSITPLNTDLDDQTVYLTEPNIPVESNSVETRKFVYGDYFFVVSPATNIANSGNNGFHVGTCVNVFDLVNKNFITAIKTEADCQFSTDTDNRTVDVSGVNPMALLSRPMYDVSFTPKGVGYELVNNKTVQAEIRVGIALSRKDGTISPCNGIVNVHIEAK